jgi:dolichol kinase
MNLELRRKLFHIFSILLWLLPLFLLPRPLLLLLCLLVILLNLSLVFKLGKDRLKSIYDLIYYFEREKNFKKPSIQALWLNLGVFLSFISFPKECSAVGVVITAVGDGFAGIVGYHFGKTKIGNKSLEGALAFFVSTSLVLFPFLGPKAFLVALAGTLAELFSKRIDDNFLLPLIGSLVACL